MAGFDDCIRSAQKQGALSEDEADALIRRYEEHRTALSESGAADVDAGAKAAFAKEMDDRGAIRKAMATGAAETQAAVGDYLKSYRTLKGEPNAFEAALNLIESFGTGAGTSSVRNRATATFNLAVSDMEGVLTEFRRSRFSGVRMNKPAFENVIREMRGENTGSAEAKGFAEAIANGLEGLRQKFNKAARYEAIGKLEGYIPQSHNTEAVIKAGREGWIDYIKPKLDLEQMRDPLTGGKLTPERLDQTLNVAWEHIVTGGWSDREPSMVPFGKGAVSGQRSDHRFLHFKTADDWLSYNRDFGTGDPTKAIFGHMRTISNDIAAMELLGPNPNAMVTYLRQVVLSEAAKGAKGAESLLPNTSVKDAEAMGARLQGVYDMVRGNSAGKGGFWATTFGDISNLLTSAYLGSTSILAASTDPFIDRTVRAFNGLPPTKALWGILDVMKSTQSRAELIRSGLGLDDFLHISGTEARYSGILGGREWSRWLADRTVNLNGLDAITQARRHTFGRDFQGLTADESGKAWGELNPYFRRAMENYGLVEKDWNKLRKTELYAPEGSKGYLQPSDVKDQALGIRYLEMILGETERAVPTGTARSRATFTMGAERGTIWGELLNSGLQFKNFPLSFTTLQWAAMSQEAYGAGGGRWGMAARGGAYAGALMIPLTLGGALSVQLNNLVNLKDAQPVDPSTQQGFKFWMQAMLKGGGLGLLGDYLFQDYTRYGNSPIEQLAGPTFGLISDGLKLIVGNAQKALTGKPTHVGREAVRTLGRNVPIVSSHPFTRGAYQRLVLDQLEYLVDPEAHKYFNDKKQRMYRETGQRFYWQPGELGPDRGPDWPLANK